MMRLKLVDVNAMTEVRYKYLQVGYLNKKGIQEFVPCGYRRAKQIYDEIRSNIKLEGYENIDNVVLTKRLIKYLNIDERLIREMYADMKKSAPDVQISEH